jgi:hypothetical protein
MKIKEIFTESTSKIKLKKWQLKTKDEIIKWMNDNHMNEFQIDRDLQVHLLERLEMGSRLNPTPMSEMFPGQTSSYKLPANFAFSAGVFIRAPLASLEGFPLLITKGSVELEDTKLSNFEGCPQVIQQSYAQTYEFSVKNLTKIKSCEGLPNTIKRVRIEAPEILSLEGLNTSITLLTLKGFQDANQIIKYCPNLEFIMLKLDMSKPLKLLSLLKLKALKEVNITELNADLSRTARSVQVSKIINKYLNQEQPDLLGCQDELIDNGYSAFAR